MHTFTLTQTKGKKENHFHTHIVTSERMQKKGHREAPEMRKEPEKEKGMR